MVESTGFENRQARKGLESSNLSSSAQLYMRILSIETSCDETGVALLEITGPAAKPEVKILGNTLYSQAKLHEEFGGVFPMLAKREHMKNLPILLEKTLTEAGESADNPNLDLIAVTTGPGLEPALWTGITFAKELSEKWEKPIMPVNHMEGHIFSVLPGLKTDQELTLPALALLISGGHTELVEISDFHTFNVIGKTLDDAAGEAFDKVARMIGVPYPGGPRVSALAEKNRLEKPDPAFLLPRPMLHSQNLNFSFSGLKTAVLYKIRDEKRDNEAFKEDLARAFEDSVTDVLVAKTREALDERPETKTLIVAGGVAANTNIRKHIENLAGTFPSLTLLFPPQGLTTDNAVMIGIAGYIRAITQPELLSGTEALQAMGNLSL